MRNTCLRRGKITDQTIPYWRSYALTSSLTSMGKSVVKLDSEKVKVSRSTYNPYVDIGSGNPSGKRAVFRTKSEPITSKMNMNCGKRIFAQNTCKQGSTVTPSRQGLQNETLYMMLQPPNESSKKKNTYVSTATVSCKNSGLHFKSTLNRSTSMSEGDLRKSHYTESAEERQIRKSNQDSTMDSDILTLSSLSCQPVAREADLSRSVITVQPCPSKQVDCDLSDDIPAKDKCFRCLRTLQGIVNCCTCLWCFDACCYHCFKDDVGYTSWFKEMTSCNKRPIENIQQWGLFGLATIAFPCILFYPILGGAVNQCLKCRLAKYHSS